MEGILISFTISVLISVIWAYGISTESKQDDESNEDL
jgi:hypothetical protein